MRKVKDCIRQADPSEEEWINEHYAEAGFVPSDLRSEYVVVAIHADVRAALGRLVPVGTQCAELGGIYVLPEFRGLGLARAVVRHLLRQGAVFQRLFCLPFAHVAPLYVKLGFRPCIDTDDIPQEIRHKHQWCNSHYEHSTLLLVRAE